MTRANDPTPPITRGGEDGSSLAALDICGSVFKEGPLGTGIQKVLLASPRRLGGYSMAPKRRRNTRQDREKAHAFLGK